MAPIAFTGPFGGHPLYSPVMAIGAIASHQLWSIGAVALPQLLTLPYATPSSPLG